MKRKELVPQVSRILMAAVFLHAGLRKMVDRESTESTLKNFGVSNNVLPLSSRLLPVSEVLIAASLLVRSTALAGVMAAAGGLLVFTSATVYQLMKGRRFSCGCFGGSSKQAIGWTMVLRNSALFLLCVLPHMRGLNQTPGAKAFHWTFGVPQFRGISRRDVVVTVLLALHSALILRTLVLLGNIIERNRPPQRHTFGEGESAPFFELESLSIDADKDALLRLEEIISPNGVALLFTSSDCQYCEEVYESIAYTQTGVPIALIVQGHREAARAVKARVPAAIVLHDDRQVVTDAYKIAAVPSLLLIDSLAKVVSPVRLGIEDIGAELKRMAR